MTFVRFMGGGDSLGMNTGSFSYSGGGTGTFLEVVADLIGAIPGIGPRLGPGLRLTALGYVGNPVEWTFAGAHTNVVPGDAHNKCAYSGTAAVHGFRIMTAQASVDTWTRPTYMPKILGGIAVDWIDLTAGGRWQYRINGGTWTQIPDTPLHNNSLRRFYLSNVAAIETFEARGYDGSADCQALIHDVDPYYVTPQGASGWIFDNIAINGSLLHELVTITTGDDPMAILDSVVLGSGSPISPAPTAGFINININDVARADATGFATDYAALDTRLTVPLYAINPWETTFNAAQQTAYRAAVQGSGIAFLDMYDEWSRMGITGNTQTATAGFVIADGIHPTQAAHRDIAPRVYGFLRNRVTALGGTAAPTYPVSAAVATPAFAGARPALAVSAGTPLAIR